MKTRRSMMLMALALAFGVVSFIQANIASAAIPSQSYMGEIVVYDQAAETLIVQGVQGEAKMFDVSDAEMKNGTIQPNETVMVNYSKINGRMVASSVDVLNPPNQMGAPETGGIHAEGGGSY